MARSLPVLLLLALATSSLAGCGILKKKQADAAPSASQVALQPPPVAPPVSPTPAPTAAPEVAVADEAVATPEDFEDEAFAKISDKTYKAELDSLKKELASK